MKNMKLLLLGFLSCVTLVTLPSCAPLSPVPVYDVASIDRAGNRVTDVITVTNEVYSIPLFDGHSVEVRSMITGREWVRRFAHEALEDQYYLIWSNGTHTRVSYQEALRHCRIINFRSH